MPGRVLITLQECLCDVKYFCLTPSAGHDIVADAVDKIYEESLLFDFYGELLTERQKQVFEDVVLGDLSLSEAAEEYGISRQAVHDLLRRTKEALDGYEAKLGLVKRFLSIRASVEEIKASSAGNETIRELADRILEEI